MTYAARTLASVTITLLALAACSTAPVPGTAPTTVRSGEVGVEELSATIASSDRIVLGDNENFLPPLPEPGNAPPAYPAELLAQRLPPQVVCLRVSVSEAGSVTASSPLVRPPDCVALDATVQPFVAAAQAVVGGWRYDPAVRCVFEHSPKPDYPTCVDARETPQAVSLTYRFVFEQHDGRGSVRMTP